MGNLPASLKRARNAERANRMDFTTAFGQLKISEQNFVLAYLKNDDPRVAIREAFPGIQKNVENVRALDMMRRPLVQAAIAEKHNEKMRRFDLSIDRVIEEIALVGFARMGDYVKRNDDGTLSMDLTGIPDDELSERLAAVSEVTFDETESADGKIERKIKFKLHPKLDALDKIMKRYGAYAPEQLQLSAPGGGPVQFVSVTMTPDEARKEWEKLLDD